MLSQDSTVYIYIYIYPIHSIILEKRN